MSGHSKWATTKHKKAAADSKRGKVFTKITKELTIAAKLGGGDPEGNPRLRTAVLKAKEANMPADNMKRAIQKGTGELPGVNYEEITYEGYGPAGVALMIECLTDNKNRTVAEVRHILGKGGGSMGESGCVSWMFNQKGYIVVDKNNATEEQLMEIALEAGAEDIVAGPEEPNFEIFTAPHDFDAVRDALAAKGVKMEVSEVTMVPQTYIKLEGKEAAQMVRLMDALEDNDDTQNIYANFDIPDEVMDSL
ncbi:MAG TPA: YebC/PmpR family DNA-binding transcriptional regulator [Nitrospirota bacterium]|jgi:YebC/PmpR family DNA-binding regulatory protein